MSDRIDISSGGAISVDSDELRALAPRFSLVADRLRDAVAELARAGHELEWLPQEYVRASGLGSLQRGVREVSESLDANAASTILMAEAYEIVEARVRQDFFPTLPTVTSKDFTVLVCDHVLRERSNPEAAALADELVAQWESDRHRGMQLQAFLAGGALGLPWMLLAQWFARWVLGKIDAVGAGVIPPGSRLEGDAKSSQLRGGPVLDDEGNIDQVEPMSSLAQVITRIPQGDAQVMVERYEMPDGSVEFFVHIAGTRAIGGSDPWNWGSNLDLYFGEASASYEAVRQALAQAGVRPGDAVHASGHSQGAMIASRLAMEGEYEVRTLVTAGSPVEPVLPDSVLVVQLRHTDDPVSALAGGGSPAGTGSSDSVVVTRVADPASGIQDAFAFAHSPKLYEETAGMVDRSDDPRTRALDDLWTRLGAAEDVTAMSFEADGSRPNGY